MLIDMQINMLPTQLQIANIKWAIIECVHENIFVIKYTSLTFTGDYETHIYMFTDNIQCSSHSWTYLNGG